MNTGVRNLTLYRFIKRLEVAKAAAANVSSLANNAKEQLEAMNVQLRRNVEAQKIVNKHLASAGKQRIATPPVAKKCHLSLVV